MLQDPRKPHTFKPRSESVLIVDANNFSRNLLAEILRGINVLKISSSRDRASAMTMLGERPIDIILLSWDMGDEFDGLGFSRLIRRLPEDRLRRLPIILVTSGLDRQTVLAGRDAGVDEFLAKPISPNAMKQRLMMVTETPRPFVDCSVYVGPCRRRKNPADYYGPKRRNGERADDRGQMFLDEEEQAAKSPIRVALSKLRHSCAAIRGSSPETIEIAIADLHGARDIAVANKDSSLMSAMAAFEAYVSASAPLGQLDPHVVNTALAALEQLSMLPMGYKEARDSVAIALGKAIHKRLAA